MESINIIYVLYNYTDSRKNAEYFFKRLQGAKNIRFNVIILLASHSSESHTFRQISKFLPSDSIIVDNAPENDLRCYYIGAIKARELDTHVTFFLNSSCTGPFLPAWSNEDQFFSQVIQILSDYDVLAPLVEFPRDDAAFSILPLESRTIISDNCRDIPFIHSYAFMVTKSALSKILSNNLLPKDSVTKSDAIVYYERLITAGILDLGLRISVMATLQPRELSVHLSALWNPSIHTPEGTLITCPEVLGNYYGCNIMPFDVVFYKNVRHASAHRGQQIAGIPKDIEVFIDNQFSLYNVI